MDSCALPGIVAAVLRSCLHTPGGRSAALCWACCMACMTPPCPLHVGLLLGCCALCLLHGPHQQHVCMVAFLSAWHATMIIALDLSLQALGTSRLNSAI